MKKTPKELVSPKDGLQPHANPDSYIILLD